MNIHNFLAESRQYLALNTASAGQRAAISNITAKLQRSTMTSYRKVAQTLLLVAGFGAFAAAPALAEPGCHHMGDRQGHYAKMQERHHQQLHAALKLSPEQEAGWTKLMESEQARPAFSEEQHAEWAKLKAPERAEKMLEMSKTRQAQMGEHVAVLKSFYASLTPEQQNTFEDFHASHHGKMHGKGRMKVPEQEKAASKP